MVGDVVYCIEYFMLLMIGILTIDSPAIGRIKLDDDRDVRICEPHISITAVCDLDSVRYYSTMYYDSVRFSPKIPHPIGIMR